MSLAVNADRVFWLAPDAVVCVDAKTGADVWRTERNVARQRPNWSAPTLVVQDGVVLCADRRATPVPDVDESTGRPMPRWLAEGAGAGDLVAYSATTGQPLWTAKCGESYHAPIDVFVGDGLVWLGQSRARHGSDYTAGLDLLTGQVNRRITSERAFATTMPHHRCYRDRATARYLVAGRTGVELIDLQTGEAFRHHWVRGACQYGVVPANGLLYAPPHACACYIEAKLTGFNALAPRREAERGKRKADKVEGGKGQADDRMRLERGPAYDAPIPSPQSLIPSPSSSDWPTHRHDPARSGSSQVAVPADLKCAWQARPGGRLSSPVIAEGRTLVASVDAHTVHAFDTHDGKPLWQYTAGGRVDSPPTVSGGLAVFGSADGWVYCVRAADGQLAWRYRVAPEERRLVAFGQIESAWPVHGCVLVHDGSVYCAAGRSSYLDGGIRLHRLDLGTGKTLASECVSSRDPRTGEQPAEPIIFEMPGALPDILSYDGKLVYMRHLGFDPASLKPRKPSAHLYSPAGFLNDDWWHRTY
jgi:outer membrane protein assembly factor BamB